MAETPKFAPNFIYLLFKYFGRLLNIDDLLLFILVVRIESYFQQQQYEKMKHIFLMKIKRELGFNRRPLLDMIYNC